MNQFIRTSLFSLIASVGLLTSLNQAAPEVVEFDVLTDLDDNFTHAKTAAINVGFASSSGIDASGAVSLIGNSDDDAGMAAIYMPGGSPFILDATGSNNVWTTSIFVDGKAFGGDPAPFAEDEKEKIKVTIGFSGTDNLTDPRKFFDKKNNDSANFRAQVLADVELKLEHKSGKELELKSSIKNFRGFDQEDKIDAIELTELYPGPYDLYATWLRLDFKLEFLGDGQIRLTSSVYDVGADGTSTPALLGGGSTDVSNSLLASYTTVYAAFSAEVEKKASNHKTFHIDRFTVEQQALVPDVPTATAASTVLSSAAIANWEPAATGAAATGYVVELSTKADNFAANTLIDASGVGGQATGIVVSGGSVDFLELTGLTESTEYVYRVLATNQAGSSPVSGVIEFTTAAPGVNAQPTLDALADVGPLWPDAGTQTVNLSGITAGFGDSGQTLTVTALSSDTGVIPDPSVTYTSPDETGSLQFTPTGTEGSAVITVTVDDGQTTDNTVVQTFSITVRTPPEVVEFDTVDTVNEEFEIPVQQNSDLFFVSDGGVGDPSGAGLYFQANSTDDNGVVLVRNQAYPGSPLPSLMRNSVLINARELAQDPTTVDKHKAEVFLGFRNQIFPADSKAKDYYKKGGSTSRAVVAKFKYNHEPSKAKFHQIEMELLSFVGENETKSAKSAVTNDISLFQNWLRFTFEAIPISTTDLILVYKVEDLGIDGLSAPELVIEDSFEVSNADFLAAQDIYPGLVLTTEKDMTSRGVYLDNHRVKFLYTAPDAPQVLAADLVTPDKARLNWAGAEEGAVPSFYVVELSADPAFPANQFIAADGTVGQAAGITVSSSTARNLAITGLANATTYYYRVQGGNQIGLSDPSSTQSFTTLAAGVNAPPTFDVIADLTLTEDTGEQVLTIKGVTDGGEGDQTVSFSVTTDNPTLITNLSVDYNSPNPTGELIFTPALGVSGSATITLTANDGASNNNTLQRTFQVEIIQVDILRTFGVADELTEMILHTQNADLLHIPNGANPEEEVGASSPSGKNGMVEFDRNETSSDKGAVALRPYAYDARAAGYWVTSVFVHASEIAQVTSGKDNADIRLGMVATPDAATKVQDTFHKFQPALGVRLKMEHEPGKADKEYKIEAESYSTTPKVGGGFDDSKGGKQETNNQGVFSNWIKLNFQAVRKSFNQYDLSYTVEDWGPDGSAFVSRILVGEPLTVTNGSFANDGEVYAGFLVRGDKSNSTSIYLDNHEVIANTKAPDAPLTQSALDITSSGFTVSWLASTIGRSVTGFVVEVVRDVSDFFAGLFLGTDGSTQAAGVEVADPFEENLAFSGMDAFTEYFWRVKAFNADDTSLALAPVATRTDALSLEEWKELFFTFEELLDPEISGDDVDVEGDGLTILEEFSLGGHPRLPDSGLVSQGVSPGNKLTIQFRRRAGSLELIYTVLAADKLDGVWSSEGILPISVSEPDSEGMETVVYEDTVGFGSVPSRFMTVDVERIP